MVLRDTSTSPRLSERTALICAGAAAFLGGLGLLGWVTPWRVLARMSPASIPMAPRTALALLLLGATLMLDARRRSPRLTTAVSLFVLTLTGLQLGRFVAGLPPKFDALLVQHPDMFDGVPTPPLSPWTAFGLVLASLSLLLASLSLLLSGLARRHGAYGALAGILAFAVCLLGIVIALGYLFGSPLLPGSSVVPMAFPTALAVGCLGLALLGLTPKDSAPLRPFIGSSARAKLLRAFLPVAPAILAVEVLCGQVEGLSPALHAALTALLSGFVVAVIVSYAAHGVSRELERAQAERERSRRDADRLAAIVQSSSDAIYAESLDGTIVAWNASAMRLFGYAQDESLGRSANILVPRGAEDEPTAILERLASGEGKDHKETNRVRKDGTHVLVSLSESPLRDADGRVVGLSVIARDVSEQRRAEKALLESEEQFRLLNDMADATRTLADPGQIMEVMSRMLGEHLRASRCAYADVENDGEQFTILHDYTDGCSSTVGTYHLSLFGARAVATLNRGETLIIRNVEVELLPGEGADMFNAIGIKAIVTCPLVKDGGLRAMMAVHQATPRDWTTGEVAIVQEVVERCWATIQRRTAEERLRESEALLRIAGHTALLGGWAVDLPQGRITWSDEVCAIHDVPPGTVPGLEQAFSFYAPQSRETVSKAFEACAQQGTPFDLELELITAKGRRVLVRSIGQAQRHAGGAITRVQGAFQDITERKQLESQLQQSQKMEAVGRLAGGVAHDFNNVLSVILGYTELLMRQVGEAQRSKLEQILNATLRAAGLTRQLLAFSRKQIVEPKVLDLNVLLSDLEEMLGRLIGEDIDLAIVGGADLGQVKADPGQLEQVVMNLCVNARDAMPDGGLLRIETANAELDARHAAPHEPIAPGRYVMVAVSDGGCGIEKEILSKIFDPFFTTKAAGKGTGLGLAMVYGIVKQAGGHVWAYSELGEGTIFKIYLPRVDEPAEAPGVQEAPMPAKGWETILLVEDEAAVRAIAREILEEHGYRVIEGAGGTEAIELARRHPEPIHLLVTDVVMPGMNGRALAESLVAARPELRVLYMSGYTDDVIAQRGVLESGTLLIEKPFTALALLRCVRRALGDRRTVENA